MLSCFTCQCCLLYHFDMSCLSFSPGSCFFLPHGARVCNKLLEFIKKQYWKRGYEEVSELFGNICVATVSL